MDMLSEVLSWGAKIQFITGDSWYSSTANLKTIRKQSKKNEGLMPSFFCIKLALKDSVPDSDAQVLKEAFESDPSLVDLGVEFQAEFFQPNKKFDPASIM